MSSVAAFFAGLVTYAITFAILGAVFSIIHMFLLDFVLKIYKFLIREPSSMFKYFASSIYCMFGGYFLASLFAFTFALSVMKGIDNVSIWPKYLALVILTIGSISAFKGFMSKSMNIGTFLGLIVGFFVN